MFENFFKRNQTPDQPTALDLFLESINSENWDYLAALKIKPGQLHRATHEMIMDNPGDVAIGVNQVEVVLGTQFFSLFGSLVIKHHDDGEIRLMFNEQISDSRKVLAVFNRLKARFGEGVHYEPKFTSFNNQVKVASLAQGKFDSPTDEILHFWHQGRFGFTLNYKIDPLRQLVFIVTYGPEKAKDTETRKNGTLLCLLTNDIQEVSARQEISADPVIEDGIIKFVDYTYKLSPPELSIFDLVRIRIFGSQKSLTDVKSLLVTYLSSQKVDSLSVIRLVDKLVKIYGADGSGYAEMRPHEIDMVDEDPYWTGRSWFINQHHGLQDMDDPEQHTLYWVNLTLNPEEGLNLSILGFDAMQDYENTTMSNPV